MDQPFSYITKVFYLVPLVCNECSLCVLTETDGRGHSCIVSVLLTVSANVKRKAIVIKTFLNTLADVSDGFAAKRYPIVTRQVIQNQVL